MVTRTPEIGLITKQTHDIKLRKWGKLNEEIQMIPDKNDPLFPEYARLSTNAATKLKEAELLRSLPNGSNHILKIYDEVNALYDRCVQISIELYDKNLRKNAVMNSGNTFRQHFDEVVMKSNPAQEPVAQDALGGIEKIIGRLETSIADIDTQKSFFTKGPGGQIGVNYGVIGEERKMLDRVKKANLNMDGTEKFEGLTALIGNIEKQIDFIEQTDPAGPARRELHEWKRQYIDGMKGPFDWRPLRLAGIVTTGLVATLGLGISFTRTAFKKEPFAIDFATGGWATGLALLAFPGFFEDKTSSGLKVVEKTNTNTWQNLQSAEKIGTGEDAYKVYEELQGLTNDKDFKYLLTLKEVSMAQLGACTKNATVLKIFERQFGNDAERAQALKVLGTKVSQGEKEFVATLIRTGKINVS